MVQSLAPEFPELLDALAVELEERDVDDGVACLANAIAAGETSASALEQRVLLRAAPLRRGDGEAQGVLAVALPSGAAAPHQAQADFAGQRVLTPRQLDVLRLLAAGMTTEAIAARLGVAVETARNHIRALLRRLEVHSRLEAVVEARRRGLIQD